MRRVSARDDQLSLETRCGSCRIVVVPTEKAKGPLKYPKRREISSAANDEETRKDGIRVYGF